MEKSFDSNKDFYALGLPRKAFDLTVYDPAELQSFLYYDQLKTHLDIESEEEFLLFYRNVQGIEEAVNIMSNSRNELVKIFSPFNILTRDDLGFWRMLFNTSQKLQSGAEFSKKKLTRDPRGPHYSIESRPHVHSVIRAKGISFTQTEALFLEAVGNTLTVENQQE
jgi:hypothetical protein